MEKIQNAVHFHTVNVDIRSEWRRLFIEIGDVTGYQFATTYVEGGYLGWTRLLRSPTRRRSFDDIEEWTRTLEIKLQSEAILRIAENKDNFNANKWLAEKGWRPKEDKRTKEGKEMKKQVDEAISEDMNRLGLVSGTETRQ